MSLVRNVRTPEGSLLGKEVVRLFEPCIDKLAAAGQPDQRCATCAFRPGTLANGSPQTQMDVMKCIIEGAPFHCHDTTGGRGSGHLCWGYVAARDGMTATSNRVCPWPFSTGYDSLEEARTAEGSPDVRTSLPTPQNPDSQTGR